MDPLLLYLGASILGVSNMILWGLYGDLLVERFEWTKVGRSIFFAILAGSFIYFLDQDLPLLLVALSSIALERLLTELYKALWRIEDQNKYAIPSDLGFRFNGTLRRSLFVISTVVIVLVLMTISLPPLGLFLGLLAGIITAIGGALKDAPHEGFHLIKFFRSPLIATVLGTMLGQIFFQTEGLILLLSIFGGERIVSEFYKKILMGRVPGKFKEGLPQTESWKQHRKWIILLYVVDIVAIVLLAFL